MIFEQEIRWIPIFKKTVICESSPNQQKDMKFNKWDLNRFAVGKGRYKEFCMPFKMMLFLLLCLNI